MEVAIVATDGDAPGKLAGSDETPRTEALIWDDDGPGAVAAAAAVAAAQPPTLALNL